MCQRVAEEGGCAAGASLLGETRRHDPMRHSQMLGRSVAGAAVWSAQQKAGIRREARTVPEGGCTFRVLLEAGYTALSLWLLMSGETCCAVL
jgi:hypothetical protein